MRVKNKNLNLSDKNKKVVYKEELDTPLESYYHMGANCSLYNIDGIKYLMNIDDLSYLRADEYLQTIHKVKADEVNRLDKISYKYYNTPELFWLIASVNYIDPFELYEGQELFIPNLRAFDFVAMNKDTFQQKSSFI